MRKAVLSIKDNNSKQYPFRIEGHRENGKRKRLFFKTKGDAEIKLAQLKGIQAREGDDAANLTMDQRTDAVRAFDILKPYGASLVDAATLYAERMKALDRSRKVSEVHKELKASKRKDGASHNHLQAIDIHINKFSESYGDELVASLESVTIDDWLRGLEVAPLTRNNYRRYLNLFFNYAVARGYCETNPVAKTAKAKVVSESPEIFTPEEVQTLMAQAWEKVPEIVPFFAIGFFAGIRVAEIKRLEWKDIKLNRSFIEVGAKSAKSASRRLVTIEPCLKEWLLPYAQSTGKVCSANHRKLFEKVRTDSKVQWKDNGIRHSFASYHLAHYQDAAKTAMQLGHPNTNMLYKHYRELVTPEEAQLFWAITPSAAQNVIPLKHAG